MEFTGLKGGESSFDRGPGLFSLEFRHPLDQESEDTDLYMSLNALREPVVHRFHLDPGSLDCPEATLNDKQSFLACGGVFHGDGVVVGL
jgi:hypothetical protein